MKKNVIVAGILSVVVVISCAAGGAVMALKFNNNNNILDMNDKETETVETLNGWYEFNGEWYFYKDNEKQSEWIEDNKLWYYLGNDGKMRTGWIKSNNEWYYLNQDGSMASNVTIDGCYLNENGLIEITPKNDISNKVEDSYISCLEYARSYFENSHQMGYEYDVKCDKKLNNKGEYIFLFYNKLSGDLVDGCYVDASTKKIKSIEDLNIYRENSGDKDVNYYREIVRKNTTLNLNHYIEVGYEYKNSYKVKWFDLYVDRAIKFYMQDINYELDPQACMVDLDTEKVYLLRTGPGLTEDKNGQVIKEFEFKYE